MHVIFNNEYLAVSGLLPNDHCVIELDPFESYGTQYGLFIPFNQFMGEPFIHWVRTEYGKANPERFANKLVVVDMAFLHVDNEGKFWILTVDTEHNFIAKQRYSSKAFNAAGVIKDQYINNNVILRDAENIAQAVELIHERTVNQIHRPIVLNAQDWIDHAVKKGYKTTDVFNATQCHSSVNRKGK